MLVPLSWLKEYVDISVSPQELQKALFDCGFEVETLTQPGADLSGVVVGQVTECDPIPDTHLHVCQVNCGMHGCFQICCGADNVQTGGKYPVALVGATVYETEKDHVTIKGVMKIKKGKLRGIESFGMLCSGTELGLNDDLYLGADYCGLLVLPEDTKIGEDIHSVVGLDDWIFDISITANRPDCQSILGIAREVAATLGQPIRMPALDYVCSGELLEHFDVMVDAKDLCPCYLARFVKNIRVGTSPSWMRRRLALVGIRSISNIVDITNYVLKEVGQPMHAFDLRHLEGNSICVRRAMNDEKIVTLDEKEFTLNSSNLVICDAKQPVALAGVMGGLHSEIQADTTNIMFEAAKFARDNVRRTARSLGQHSDSSARFEKGVDTYTTGLGMQRALHLIHELNCGMIVDTKVSIADEIQQERRSLTISCKAIDALLGIAVPHEDVVRILTNLDFQPSMFNDLLTVHVPLYREDVENMPDIAEEIIRMYGYSHIQPTFLANASVTTGGRNKEQNQLAKLKQILCEQGCDEAVHYSFYSPKSLDLLRLPEDAKERVAIQIANPISEELSIMRTMLAPSMVEAVIRNVRRGNDSGRIFEFARTFHAKSFPLTDAPEEREAVCFGLFGQKVDFFDGKAVTEAIANAFHLNISYQKPRDVSQFPFLHPGMSAVLFVGDTQIGWLGMLAHDLCDTLIQDHVVCLCELSWTAMSPFLHMEPRFLPLPKYPLVTRDLALLVDRKVLCGELEACMRLACSKITQIRLFDVYSGEQIAKEQQSLAFSLTFTPDDHAFTDKEIDKMVANVLKKLNQSFGALQR